MIHKLLPKQITCRPCSGCVTNSLEFDFYQNSENAMEKYDDCVGAIQSLINCVTNAKQRKMAATRKRNNAM